MAVREAPSNRTIGGFVLGARLGRGGAGEVYAARHPAHGETLAVKLVTDLHAPDADARHALAEEAARARAISHPAVVRVIDVGYDAEVGIAYLAMERIAGEELGSRLARGLLSDGEARALFGAIADGMAAVHAAGLVHRDLKPANVMLREGAPCIVDFGIARVVGERGVHVTRRRMGTIEYMAPEQLTSGLVAPSVDIWALGVMMFEAVTGELPFRGFADGRVPQLFEAPPRAAHVAATKALAPISLALDELIARCLERDPARRPPSMAAVARELAGGAMRGDAEERITQDVDAPRAVAVRTADDRPTQIDLPDDRRSDPFGAAQPARRPTWFVVGAVVAAIVGVGAAQLVARSPGPQPTVPIGRVLEVPVPRVPPSLRPAPPAPALVEPAPVIVVDPPAEPPREIAMPADPIQRRPSKRGRKPAAKPAPVRHHEGLD